MVQKNTKNTKTKLVFVRFFCVWCMIGFFLGTTNTIFAQKSTFQTVDTLLKSESSFDAYKALKILEEELVKDSTKAMYWIKHAKASYQFFRYENAQISIEKATQKEPKNDIAHFEKGILYNATHIKKLDIALQAFSIAINLKPKKGEYYYYRGIIYSQMQNTQEAEIDYNKALSLNFETPELHLNLAVALAEKTVPDLEKAILHTQKAIKLDKNYPQAYAVQAKCRLRNHDIKGACADVRTANALGYKELNIPDSVCNGNKSMQYRFLAEILVLNKQIPDAIKAFEILVNEKNVRSDDFLNKGYSHFQLKQYAQAEKDFLKALTLPNAFKDKLYDNLSLLYFKQELYEKSVFYTTARIALNANNHVAYLDRGLCYRMLKKYRESEIDFNNSLRIEPDFFRAFAYRAKLYLDMEKMQEAKDDAEKAVFINKKYDYGYFILGQIKYAMKKPDFCDEFQRAKSLGNEDADEALKKLCK